MGTSFIQSKSTSVCVGVVGRGLDVDAVLEWIKLYYELCLLVPGSIPSSAKHRCAFGR